jgi:hypothetical protein
MVVDPGGEYAPGQLNRVISEVICYLCSQVSRLRVTVPELRVRSPGDPSEKGFSFRRVPTLEVQACEIALHHQRPLVAPGPIIAATLHLAKAAGKWFRYLSSELDVLGADRQARHERTLL